MKLPNIFLLSDIEGSSGCMNRRCAQFRTSEWANACLAMTQDTNSVVTALLDAGFRSIIVQDFHRTGFNLLPELIDGRVSVRQGYRPGLIPGIGNPPAKGLLLLLGMHAASGTAGFLPHTLTSRFRHISIDGRTLCESELFAGVLAQFGQQPVFVSGDKLACEQAQQSIEGICSFVRPEPPMGKVEAQDWRRRLGEESMRAARVYAAREIFSFPIKPLQIECWFHSEQSAREIVALWGVLEHSPQGSSGKGFSQAGKMVAFCAKSYLEVYSTLTKWAYLTPTIQAFLPL